MNSNQDINKGYSLAITNCTTKETVEKIYKKPMSLYIPDIAHQAVAELINKLAQTTDADNKGLTLTITNKNNGVSVDKDFATIDALMDLNITADAVKDLINIVRGYDTDEENNVCGW